MHRADSSTTDQRVSVWCAVLDLNPVVETPHRAGVVRGYAVGYPAENARVPDLKRKGLTKSPKLIRLV
jgi:hypothetical protein